MTNGFAEVRNNRINVIIGTGYGYRNVTNPIRRILLDQPLRSTLIELLDVEPVWAAS